MSPADRECRSPATERYLVKTGNVGRWHLVICDDSRTYVHQTLGSFSDVNDCLVHLCANGATCVDQVAGYVCQCAPGYTGTYCQTSMTLILLLNAERLNYQYEMIM